jgi:hypothetical protein
MAISGTKSMAVLTKELGVNEKTPESWTADSKRELGIADTARLREAQPKPDPELVAARKIIAELKKENDLLDRLWPAFRSGTSSTLARMHCLEEGRVR